MKGEVHLNHGTSSEPLLKPETGSTITGSNSKTKRAGDMGMQI